MNIVRTQKKVTGGITPEEKVALDAHAAKWIANAMSTAPVNPSKLTAAIKSLYRAANLREPRVVIVASPMVMAFAGGFAAAIWWLRKNGAALPPDQATHQATAQATDQATRQATDQATAQATDQAAYQATRQATDQATRQATRQATHQATAQATDQATRQATRQAAEQATAQATDQATHQATRQAAYQATRQATHQATHQATDQATRQATEQATRQATRQAAEQATAQAAYQAAYQATDQYGWAIDLANSLAREFGGSAEFFISCAQRWANMYQGGNMWSYYDCYLSAFRDVLGLRLPEHEKYAAWEACAIEGGFRVVHEEFCIVSDRPEILKVDEQNRPHCIDGPSHRWRDGWSLYYIHGVRMPSWVIERPQEITVDAIHAETNAEVQRVMIERYGEGRYIIDSGMKPVARDERFGDIYLKTVEAGRPIAKIRVVNRSPEPDGSYRIYWLNFNPAHYGGDAGRIPQAAVASTWRTKSSGRELFFKDWRDYNPVLET